MKTQADIESRIVAEVEHFRMRDRGRGRPCYAWYTETCAERDGGILVQSESPGIGWYPITPEQIRVPGREYVQGLINKGIIGQLPVLARERKP